MFVWQVTDRTVLCAHTPWKSWQEILNLSIANREYVKRRALLLHFSCFFCAAAYHVHCFYLFLNLMQRQTRYWNIYKNFLHFFLCARSCNVLFIFLRFFPEPHESNIIYFYDIFQWNMHSTFDFHFGDLFFFCARLFCICYLRLLFVTILIMKSICHAEKLILEHWRVIW